MAPGLQLTGLRLRPGMLTSCLHLSSAGLNSALLAVPLPTPSSAHSSVPDELKMFKPAGGQGCHSLAERWHSPGVSPLWSTRVHTHLLGVHAFFPGRPVGLPHPLSPEHPSHRKSPGGQA